RGDQQPHGPRDPYRQIGQPEQPYRKFAAHPRLLDDRHSLMLADGWSVTEGGRSAMAPIRGSLSSGSGLKGRQYGARPRVTRTAFARQPQERIAGPLKLRDFVVQILDPCVCELASARTIIAAVEVKQFLALLQRETRALRLPDEPEAANVIRAVAADSIRARWRLQQSTALVKADSLDADPAAGGEPADGERLHGLTLYHGTEAISRFARR